MKVMNSYTMRMETTTPNNGWMMQLITGIGTTLIGGKTYQGRSGTSSGIGTLGSCRGYLGESSSYHP